MHSGWGVGDKGWQERSVSSSGGIMRRPREPISYEWMRKKINRNMLTELGRLKVELMKEKDIGVSFLDLDKKLYESKYTRDLVHLKPEGSKRLGGRLIEWLRASRKVHEMWQRGLEACKGNIKRDQ